MTDVQRKIYAVFGVPPEIQAYAMAKYSRSAQSMLESIGELSSTRAEEFLNTFYFQYGHRSIGDLAHVVIALENVSILAAVRVVDQPVWDGQERSTRYQDFRRTGYYVPPELGVPDESLRSLYRQTADGLFASYAELTRWLVELLIDSCPQPPEMDRRQYERTLRARAFDVARFLLPTATHTSVGQIVSSRTLERQICQLLADPLAEVRAIGEELRTACRQPAEAPVADAARPLLDRLGEMDGSGERAEILAALRALLAPPMVAPTLVKYTAPSEYLVETYRDLAEAARSLKLGPPDRSKVVDLVADDWGVTDHRSRPRTWSVGVARAGEHKAPSQPPPTASPLRSGPTPLLDEIVATLLYRVDPGGHSYRQIRDAVRELSGRQKAELLELSVRRRGRHDELLREHQAGYQLKFDILMDFGSFRDLHRHRRCVQIQQPLSVEHGYDRPEQTFARGLGAEVAAEAQRRGLDRMYVDALSRAEGAMRHLDPSLGPAALYLMPLAFRNRTLFKMDAAQAAYMIELRSGAPGHFSYRWVAYEMYRELERVAPELAAQVRATDPGAVFNLLDR